MRLNALHIGLAFLLGCILTYFLTKKSLWSEGFADASGSTKPVCNSCGTEWPCKDHDGPGATGFPVCPPMPDMSKYVLKSSIPPCASMPNLKDYMLKTECPPAPDLSQYVLKASVPAPQPVLVDTSKCGEKGGDCPPCPRPRCPQVQCPPPTVCPACPPCPRATCPQTVVKCKAEESDNSPVRPFLAPLSHMFGSA